MKTFKVVAIILYDRAGKMLLQHRTNNAEIMPNYWAFFGGGVEGNETPEKAIKREAKEELNYDLAGPRLIYENEITVPGTNEKRLLSVFIEPFDCNKNVLKLGEGQGWGWFTRQETASLKMLDHNRAILKLATEYIKGKTACTLGN